MPVMVVGLEVNNPAVNFGASAYSPSIAALASSTDAHAACYSMNAALTGEPSHATYEYYLFTYVNECLADYPE